MKLSIANDNEDVDGDGRGNDDGDDNDIDGDDDDDAIVVDDIQNVLKRRKRCQSSGNYSTH